MFTDLLSHELGYPKDAGTETRYNCPFCGSSKHKFYVHTASDKRNGLWHCFKCGERGNPVSFVMKYYHVGYQESLDILEQYDYTPDNSGFVPKDDSLSDEEYILLMLSQAFAEPESAPKPVYTPPPLPMGYKRIVDNLDKLETYPFLLYCKQRGFSFADIWRHNIGYVLDCVVPVENGRTVRLQNHLVFLTHDNTGNYIYWNTRAIGDTVPKSINAPSTDKEYSKRNTVFNLNRAKNTSCIVINEGVPDALTVGESGVATFGKQVTSEQIDLILANIQPEQKIFILLDMDAKRQMEQLGERLYPKHNETYYVINPTGSDANSLGYERTWEIINEYAVKADRLGAVKLLL